MYIVIISHTLYMMYTLFNVSLTVQTSYKLN